MTTSDFLLFYPHFTGIFPEIVLTSYVDMANARFGNLDDMAEEARGLYIAHKLTLYAKTCPAVSGGASSAASMSAIASAGDGTKITSKKVENVSVTYASSSGGASSSKAVAELEETIYGQQLLSLLKLLTIPWYLPG